MSSRELKNKPLIEAIFELRWGRQTPNIIGVGVDPNYHILSGRLYDRLHEKYPEHEQLETVNIPDEMANQVVQHRFRSAEKDWPLVQLGPGILTVNDTTGYRWESFSKRVKEALDKFYDAYPKPSELKIQNLTMRYIDAVGLEQDLGILEFLEKEMEVSISLPDNLFEETEVETIPQLFQTHMMYRSNNPLGVIQIRFSTGQHENRQALIWETIFQSAGDDLPSMPDGFECWLNDSHRLINDWFFKLIKKGTLYRRFSGEQ